MITSTQIYWLTRCDELKSFLVGVDCPFILVASMAAVVAIALTLFNVFAGNGAYELWSGVPDEQFKAMKDRAWRATKKSLAVFAVCVTMANTVNLAASFVPTTKEMAAIMVVPRIANSQSVSDIAEGIVELAKAWMVELRPAKEGDAK
jgi:hypothetical protein